MPKKSANPKPRGIVPVPTLLDPNRRYQIKVANELLGQSNSKTYEDIAEGRLKVIKDGKRTYIPGSEIIRRSTLVAVLALPPTAEDGTLPISIDRARCGWRSLRR